MEIQTLQPEKLHWMWLIVGLAAILLISKFRRQRAMRLFATPNRLLYLLPPTSQIREALSTVLILLSMLFIAIALTDIRWGKTTREVPQKGIEVVFALDVSRSMLAEDTAPNRLERAKQDIIDIVNEMNGDRVGLVIFAGEAKRYLPMTSHYEDFKLALAEVGPHHLNVGGTNLSHAIELAAKTFLSQNSDHKAIVLFTDGEDHEGNPLVTAERVHAERGIRIYTVGLGDAASGSLVPHNRRGIPEGFLKYGGELVRSKMDSELLEQIATRTSGAWIPAGTKQVDMGAVYRNYIDLIDSKEFEIRSIDVFTPRYPWFLGLALMLMFVEAITSPKTATRNVALQSRNVDGRNGDTTRLVARASSFGFLLLLSSLFASTANATDEIVELANHAIAALQNDDADLAIQLLDDAIAKKDDPRLVFNKGVAHFQKGDFETASRMFARVAGLSDANLAAKARYNLGYTDYTQGLTMLESDPPEADSAAREKLKSALEHFRATLKMNPADDDARANIELIYRLLKQLTPQDSQQEENQQEKKNQPDQNRNDGDRGQQEQDSTTKPDPEMGEDELDEARQPDSETPQNEPNQNGDQDQGNNVEKENESPRSDENNGQGDGNQQSEPKMPSSQQTQPLEDMPSLEHTQRLEMTQQEAEKMLQAVRDREFRRRLMQQQRMQSRRIPVDRDW